MRHLYGAFAPSSAAAEIATALGAQGPAAVVSTGCTSGIDSVGHAWQLIREGSADVMIVGASDAPISPITVACFDAIKATTPCNDEPEQASRPFDRSRNGFVLGEGAAVFILEEAGHARRRMADCYGEITGYASRSNAFHMTGLRPDGTEMAAAIGLALGEHAYRTPMSGIKSMVGHSLGAIGSIEIAACLLAMRYDVLPPTANLHEPDPRCDPDYVPLTARDQRVDTALTVCSGFGGCGGFQSAMVLAGVA